jgi:hypothetical protein
VGDPRQAQLVAHQAARQELWALALRYRAVVVGAALVAVVAAVFPSVTPGRVLGEFYGSPRASALARGSRNAGQAPAGLTQGLSSPPRTRGLAGGELGPGTGPVGGTGPVAGTSPAAGGLAPSSGGAGGFPAPSSSLPGLAPAPIEPATGGSAGAPSCPLPAPQLPVTVPQVDALLQALSGLCAVLTTVPSLASELPSILADLPSSAQSEQLPPPLASFVQELAFDVLIPLLSVLPLPASFPGESALTGGRLPSGGSAADPLSGLLGGSAGPGGVPLSFLTAQGADPPSSRGGPGDPPSYQGAAFGVPQDPSGSATGRDPQRPSAMDLLVGLVPGTTLPASLARMLPPLTEAGFPVAVVLFPAVTADSPGDLAAWASRVAAQLPAGSALELASSPLRPDGRGFGPSLPAEELADVLAHLGQARTRRISTGLFVPASAPAGGTWLGALAAALGPAGLGPGRALGLLQADLVDPSPGARTCRASLEALLSELQRSSLGSVPLAVTQAGPEGTFVGCPVPSPGSQDPTRPGLLVAEPVLSGVWR